MFEPMALTVILALGAAFVLSLTLVPALIAIGVTGRVQEGENRLGAAFETQSIGRCCAGDRLAIPRDRRVPLFCSSLRSFASSGLARSSFPTLDEKNIAMHALRIPSTSLTQSQAMQLAVENTVSRFPQVALVFSKTGTAEMASDPMPPNASDTFIILKPREAWPDPRSPRRR